MVFLPGMAADIFGEERAARFDRMDLVNDYLRTKYLKEYLRWSLETGNCSPTLKDDWARVNRYGHYYNGLGIAGFLFAAIVVNPNYTKRRSFYLKKFNCIFFPVIFASWGLKLQNEATLELMLRNYDYFPLEIKRTLATKDYRYLVGFDYKNPNRKLFDEKTHKSLS